MLYLSNNEQLNIPEDDLLLMNLTAVPAFYIFYYFLFNKFLRERKLKAFIAMAFLTCLLITLAINAIITTIFYVAVSGFLGAEALITLLAGFFLFALINGIAATTLRGVFHWYLELRVKEILRQKNMESQLSALKAQLQPHFLFNTINNIDVLIGKEPNRASLYLQRLSSLLRYVLYKGQSKSIRVEEELRFVHDYIELQKIRKIYEDEIQLKVEGDAKDCHIAPLIFLPFMENAFKHASSENGEPSIKIHILIKDGQIHFSCENSFSPATEKSSKDNGLGLSLAKQRLEQIYSGNHRLELRTDKNIFIVQCHIRF